MGSYYIYYSDFAFLFVYLGYQCIWRPTLFFKVTVEFLVWMNHSLFNGHAACSLAIITMLQHSYFIYVHMCRYSYRINA